MNNWPQAKYDILKVVQEEINYGDTAALYGMSKAVPALVVPAPKVKPTEPVMVSDGEDWTLFTTNPSVDGLYEVLGANSKLIWFSRYERGVWYNASERKDSAIRTFKVSVGIPAGVYSHWRHLRKDVAISKPAEPAPTAGEDGWITFGTAPQADGVYEVIADDYKGEIAFSKYAGGVWHYVLNSEHTAQNTSIASTLIPKGAFSHWRHIRKDTSTQPAELPHARVPGEDWTLLATNPSEEGVYKILHSTGKPTDRFSLYRNGIWHTATVSKLEAEQCSYESTCIRVGDYTHWKRI